MRYAGRESRDRRYPNRGGRASRTRALDVRFDAGEPGGSELKVVADLTAADKSGIAQGQNIGGARGNRIGKGLTRKRGDAGGGFQIDRIAPTEGVAGVQAGVEAGPGEDWRGRQIAGRDASGEISRDGRASESAGRTRSPPFEVIVQADANDMTVEAG